MTKRNDTVLWLVLGLGLVTTALGVAYGVATATPGAARQSVPNVVIAAVVSALGAGVVGAALSIGITRLADREGRDDLKALMTRTLGARFVSADAALGPLRGAWHHYHVTTLHDRLIWRHVSWDFDGAAQGSGSLVATLRVPDGLGHNLSYIVEAGVRGGHAVLLFSSEAGGASAQATEIFPAFATRGYQPVHAGVGTFEMWDGTPTVGRVIISRESLVGGTDETVTALDAPTLDALWERHFPGHHTVLRQAEASAERQLPEPRSSPT